MADGPANLKRFGRHFSALLAASSLMVAGCASLSQPVCRPGEKAVVSDEMFFGTSRPGGVVSEAEWDGFLKSTVTQRFPDGFTTWQGMGQWKSADGVINRETSHVLKILHPGDTGAEEHIRELIAEYKRRHRQEAVLRSRSTACVSY